MAKTVSLAAAFCFLGVGAFAAVADDIFDPPSIQVFPDHEQIGVSYPLDSAVRDGRSLFEARFNIRDGAGRPAATGDSKPTPRQHPGPMFQRLAGPDANSCAGCHNQPIVGGSGDFAANVFVGAHFSNPVTHSIASNVTNERGTPSLFGTGAVEMLAREITEELHAARRAAIAEAERTGKTVEIELRSKEIRYGVIVAHADGYVDYAKVDGIDYDLVVKPFGIKGIIISLREFSLAALNHHHGIQAVERFGWERTGRRDFDGDGKDEEFTIGQATALALFQASLPAPQKARMDHEGFRIFERVGCAECHIPTLYLRSDEFTEPNSFNRPGALTPQYVENVVTLRLELPKGDRGYVVSAFTDFKRHSMCDADRRRLCNEELRQDNVRQDLFMTARLWDVAVSAPYCHRGDCTTLTEAIRAHGGDARKAADAFERLGRAEKVALIDFLRTLGQEQHAVHAVDSVSAGSRPSAETVRTRRGAGKERAGLPMPGSASMRSGSDPWQTCSSREDWAGASSFSRYLSRLGGHAGSCRDEATDD